MGKKVVVDFGEVDALASKGYSVTMICEAIGISRAYAYKNKDVIDTIKASHTKARQRVVDDLFSRSESDQSATATIFLAKQLRVFDAPFPTSTPKKPADAVAKISNIYTAVAKGDLDAEKGTHLVGYLEKYLKAYEVNHLAKELEDITKVLKKEGLL